MIFHHSLQRDLRIGLWGCDPARLRPQRRWPTTRRADRRPSFAERERATEMESSQVTMFCFLFPFQLTFIITQNNLITTVARLTRFKGRGHKTFPKGPPFAYVYWKKFPKGPPFSYVYWKNFQRVLPLPMFIEKISKGSPLCPCLLKKISKKNYQRGEYWLLLPSPLNTPLHNKHRNMIKNNIKH